MNLDTLGDSWFFLVNSCVILWFAFRGRDTWLFFDAFGAALLGIGTIVFTEFFVSLQIDGIKGEIGAIHMEAVRTFGLYIGSLALFYFMTKNSKDPTVHTSYMWARIMGLTLSLMNDMYCLSRVKTEPEKLTAFYRKNMVPIHAVLIVCHLYHAVRMEFWGGHAEVNNRLCFHLRFDFIYLFMFAILAYAFPDSYIRTQTVIEDPTGVQIFLARFTGSWLMASAILSGRAANFQDDKDKKTFLLTRIMYIFGRMAVVCYSAFAFPHIMQPNYLLKTMIGALIWLANSVLGYLSAKNEYKSH